MEPEPGRAISQRHPDDVSSASKTTPLPGGGTEVDGVVGPRNGERLGSYTRVDLRANRDVQLAQQQAVVLSGSDEPAQQRRTSAGFEDYGLEQDSQGQPVFWRTKDYWLPMLPSFGFQ